MASPAHCRAPFLVLATQNPIEYEGTFPLPEAQLDRFLLRLRMGYPALPDERQVLRNLQHEHPIASIGPVADGDDLLARRPRDDQYPHRQLASSTTSWRSSTPRATTAISRSGASPRGSLGLFRAAQARAAILGRDYVLPDDVKALAPAVLAHRLLVRPESSLRGRTADQVVAGILDTVDPPIAVRA